MLNYLITGATSGIGKGICLRLLSQGNRVIALGRDFTKLKTESKKYTQNLIEVPCEFSDLGSLPEKFKSLGQQYDKIDGLICCAGIGQFGSLEEFSFSDIDKLMDVNFKSHVYLIKSLIPAMKKNKQGKLIFLGSESGLQGGRYGAIYCASKFALRGFAQSLRHECSRSNIQVTTINPGLVRTPFFDDLDFEPGSEVNHALSVDDVVESIMQVILMPNKSNIDEINLSPMQNVVIKKKS